MGNLGSFPPYLYRVRHRPNLPAKTRHVAPAMDPSSTRTRAPSRDLAIRRRIGEKLCSKQASIATSLTVLKSPKEESDGVPDTGS